MTVSEQLKKLKQEGKIIFPTGIDLGDFEFAAKINGLKFEKRIVETVRANVIRYTLT